MRALLGILLTVWLTLLVSHPAFAEKRAPNFKGWDNPEDRYRLPSLDTVKS